MKLKSGDLKHYIRIDAPVEGAPDRYGRRTVTWEEVAQLYAKVSDVSGREYFAAAAYQMENTVSFTIRYDSTVNSGMRVIFGGNAYDIKEVNHLGYRGDFMTLKCMKVIAEGGAADG